MPFVVASMGTFLSPSELSQAEALTPFGLIGNPGWVLLTTTAALLAWGGGRIAVRRDGLRARLYVLHDALEHALEESRRLAEAEPWIRLMGASPERARSLEQACRLAASDAQRLAVRLTGLERQFAGWRLRALEDGLARAEARASALAHAQRQVRAALAALQDERRTSERCLEDAVQRAEDLAERLTAHQHRLWVRDLDEATRLARAALAPAERAKRPGGPLETLQECLVLRRQLAELEAAFESRCATAAWLAEVPEEAARLNRSRSALIERGFRDLPRVPEASLAEGAAGALRALAAGRLREAGEAQRGLRRTLSALHRAIVGAEEQQAHNLRQIGALRAEWEALGRRLAALPPEELSRRFPERLWRGIAAAGAEAEARRQALAPALAEAERANGLELQRFDASAAALRGLEGQLRHVASTLEGCETAWRAMSASERRLTSRLSALRQAKHATDLQAASFGMASDPALAAMLEEAAAALSERPLALDEGERALAAAERLLARFIERLDDLDRRLGRSANPPRIWITRLDRAAPTSAEPASQAGEQKK